LKWHLTGSASPTWLPSNGRPRSRRSSRLCYRQVPRQRGSDFNSILVLAQHPRLSKHWLRFNAAASRGFALPARVKEIAILRVAWRSRSDYEWVQHMLAGLREGLSADDFRSLQAEDPGKSWNEIDHAVIGAADDLWRQQRVGDKVWTALSAHFSTEQILELLYVIGAYLALAGILDTANVPIEGEVLDQAMALGLPMLNKE
jgi:4-carboxymuconolactone decarboxylase